MKKFGFMLMAAAAVALSLSSCKKDNKEEELPVPTPTPVDIETPAVDGTEGAVTIVIRFDEAPCEGADVLFVGSHRDNEWKIAEAPAFEAIGDGWYKFVAYPNEGGTISGRPIQYDGETADWGNDWSHSGDDIQLVKGGSEGNIADSGYGEVNLSFTEADAADAAVVFIVCKKWNAKPCAAAAEYNLTVLVPAFCGEEFDLEVVGNFEEGDGWGSAPIAMTKEAEGKYTAKVSAKAGQQFKVRGVGDWDKGVQAFVAPDEENPEGSWKDVDNNVFGEELNITVDYSADTYRWKTCAGPVEDTGEIWIKCAGNEWTWTQMSGEEGTFTYTTTVVNADNLGANIAIDSNGTGEKWYDLGTAAANGLAEGDSYMYTFTQTELSDGTLTISALR